MTRFIVHAFGTDNNLSLAGSIGKVLPFRASVGYYNQSGLVRKDNVERWTGNIVLRLLASSRPPEVDHQCQGYS